MFAGIAGKMLDSDIFIGRFKIQFDIYGDMQIKYSYMIWCVFLEPSPFNLNFIYVYIKCLPFYICLYKKKFIISSLQFT